MGCGEAEGPTIGSVWVESVFSGGSPGSTVTDGCGRLRIAAGDGGWGVKSSPESSRMASMPVRVPAQLDAEEAAECNAGLFLPRCSGSLSWNCARSWKVDECFRPAPCSSGAAAAGVRVGLRDGSRSGNSRDLRLRGAELGCFWGGRWVLKEESEAAAVECEKRLRECAEGAFEEALLPIGTVQAARIWTTSCRTSGFPRPQSPPQPILSHFMRSQGEPSTVYDTCRQGEHTVLNWFSSLKVICQHDAESNF